MKRRLMVIVAVALVAAMLVSSLAFAAWTVDENGYGFVGKGDVQLIYGWNNQALQRNAGLVDFRVFSQTETVSTWTCSRTTPSGNEVVTPRNNTTATTTQGLLTTVARSNSSGINGPVTGFYLNGFEGEATTTTESSGQPLYSCPADQGNPSQFTYDEGSLEQTTTELGGGLQVSINSIDWYTLP